MLCAVAVLMEIPESLNHWRARSRLPTEFRIAEGVRASGKRGTRERHPASGLVHERISTSSVFSNCGDVCCYCTTDWLTTDESTTHRPTATDPPTDRPTDKRMTTNTAGGAEVVFALCSCNCERERERESTTDLECARSLALLILLALSRTHPRPAFPAVASLGLPPQSPLLLLLCYVRHSPEGGGRKKDEGRMEGGRKAASLSLPPSLLPQQPPGAKSLTTEAATATESTKRRRKEGRKEDGRRLLPSVESFGLLSFLSLPARHALLLLLRAHPARPASASSP